MSYSADRHRRVPLDRATVRQSLNVREQLAESRYLVKLVTR